MSQRKIFYENQYTAEFSATITACTPADSGFHVSLSATAFYPEGGGQPPDTGSIDGARVLDVRETDDGILHTTDVPFDVGSQVLCRLDWERRFSFMQHHTGEHIVSGLINKLYGYDNVGFHMGAEFTTMDINGELTADGLRELEILANKAVYENKAVYSRYLRESDTPDYRSKKPLTGDVRIVTVEGYDICACCGLHCQTTGEVGIIKLVTAHKYKAGMRIYMLCGLRAVSDYHRKNSDIYAMAQLFSAKPAEVAAAAAQCHSENAELKRQLAEYRSRELRLKAEQTPAGQELVCVFEDGLTSDDLRRLCLMLCEKSITAAVFSAVSDGVYRYALGSLHTDVRGLGRMLNSELNGRGGGKERLVQGTVNAERAAIEALLKQAQR